MENERSSVINIGGKEYELLLTTKATKEIAKRYGGLENLGEQLLTSEDFAEAISNEIKSQLDERQKITQLCTILHHFE